MDDVNDVQLVLTKPHARVIYPNNRAGANRLLRVVEEAGRTCYKSEDRIKAGSAKKFVSGIVKSGHLSVIEHAHVTARVFCSRAGSHQIVRHRLANYSQESQRYCDYSGENGSEGLRVICPPTVLAEGGVENLLMPGRAESVTVRPTNKSMTLWEAEIDGWEWSPLDTILNGSELDRLTVWLKMIATAYRTYLQMRSEWDPALPPQDARFVLPNATKTEIVWTQNLRQWLHVMDERALNPHAQWEIRRVTAQIGYALATKFFPSVFGHLKDDLADALDELEG